MPSAVSESRRPAPSRPPDHSTLLAQRVAYFAQQQLMMRIADEKRLPFAVQAPNATTAKALDELDAGKGKRFNNADELYKDLGI